MKEKYTKEKEELKSINEKLKKENEILKKEHEQKMKDVKLANEASNKLKSILEDIGAKIPNVMLDNTYDIEEDELVITRGVAGLVLNIDEAKDIIIKSIKDQTKEPIEIQAEYKECPEIDI